MCYRAMGILFILSGVFCLAGVLDPPILPTWGDPPAASTPTWMPARTDMIPDSAHSISAIRRATRLAVFGLIGR